MSVKLPAYIFAGSFLCLILIMSLTSPTSHIVASVFFFLFLLTFLISGGYAYFGSKNRLNPGLKFKIVAVSLFVVIAIMFRSSQSLGLVDALIFLLSIGGIIFYADRRFR